MLDEHSCPGATIGRWNTQCAARDKLQGTRRTTILNLLTLASQESIDLLLEQAGEAEQGGKAFTEDCFAQKKLLPGHYYRIAGNPLWQNRTRITKESFHSMLKACICNFKSKPVSIRRPFLFDMILIMSMIVMSMFHSHIDSHQITDHHHVEF